MTCPHCHEKINICPYCEYGMYEDEPLEEFEICPKCGKEIDTCMHCGVSLDSPKLTSHVQKEEATAAKIIGYIAIFFIIIGALYLIYYDYVMTH